MEGLLAPTRDVDTPPVILKPRRLRAVLSALFAFIILVGGLVAGHEIYIAIGLGNLFFAAQSVIPQVMHNTVVSTRRLLAASICGGLIALIGFMFGPWEQDVLHAFFWLIIGWTMPQLSLLLDQYQIVRRLARRQPSVPS